MSRNCIWSAIALTLLFYHTEGILEDYFREQTEKVNSFFREQFNIVETAVNTSYEEAVKTQNKVTDYIEEQKKKISEDVNNYVESVKVSGREIVETYSFMPTEDPNSLLESPELTLAVPSLIKSHGYDCETHTVLSQGFMLGIHRIPRPRKGGATSKKTVLLQHGLFASSADWILNGPYKSLAYVLADAGYDVWMTNIRGNKYSKENIKYKVKTKEYWNFSWHEVAVYDVPTVIDYIQKIKGDDNKIAYIGHSMGTTILFTMLSARPEYNDKLSVGIALAPEVFISNMESPLKSLTNIASNVAVTEMMYGSYEFIPKDSILGSMNEMCEAQHMDSYVCNNVIFYLCGEDEEQFNKTILPVFLKNLGTGTSWKTAVHMTQMLQSGKFQQFDYGYEERNQRMYGQPTAPEYDLSKVSLNITLFWSQNDLLSNEKDVRKLHERLPTTTEMYLVPFAKFNHIDYLWAIEAPRLVNGKIMDILKDTLGNEKQHYSFSFSFL